MRNSEPATATVDYPLVAVGDLHGQTEFLDRLVAKLRCLPEWPDLRLVFLGDLVDRGPDVKGTVQRVIDLLAEKPGSACVMGNHDLAFVKATGLDGGRSDYWVQRYGEAYDHRPTFRSYLGREPEYFSKADWVADLDALRDAVPEAHRVFFAGLPWVVCTSGHVFLHNGLSPELLEPAGVQLELLRRRAWHGYAHPRLGTVSEREYQPDYPVWLGADKSLSANPLPLGDPQPERHRLRDVPASHRVQVTGHVRVDAPDATAVRIRIDTSGGVREPLTGCLLRGPTADPVFVFSDRGSA